MKDMRWVIQVEPWEQDILPWAILILHLRGVVIQMHQQKMTVYLPKEVIERETYFRRDGGQQYDLIFPEGFLLTCNHTRVGTTYLVFYCKDLDTRPLELLQREPVFTKVDHVAVFQHRVILSNTSGHLAEVGMILPVQLLEDTRTPEQPPGRMTVRILYPGQSDAFMTLPDTSLALFLLVPPEPHAHQAPEERPPQLL